MFDHHAKELQEMRIVQEIHTRTLNEMNQQLPSILRKLSASDQGGLSQSPRIGETRSPNSSMLSLSRPMKLDFLGFSSEKPTSWVYKAN